MISNGMEEKKKILFAVTKGNFGGAQRYVYDLATNLPKDRFEAVVAAGNKDGDVLARELEEAHIRNVALENSEREIDWRSDFRCVKELVRLLKKERPEIVHLNSSKIGFLGALAVLFIKLSAPSLKLKAIFTAHGWAFNEKNRGYLSRIAFYIAHYLTVLICDKTIAVSEKTRRDIDWLPFIEGKIAVVHNGIADFEKLSPSDASQILYAGPQEKSILFSLSELNKNKGIDVALRAIALLPLDIRKEMIYCIAGSGEEKESLESLVQELGIADSVHFLGFIENGRKLLPGAHIFLLPSRNENLPYSILEAGISGLPIISTSVGGVPEMIKDMQNGILVHPQNPKEIAEAILYLLEHPQKKKEFGAEIKKTVTNFFSLEQMLSETLKILTPLR